MSSITPSTAMTERVAISRIWWVGLIAILASVLVNEAVTLLTVSLFSVPATFTPLTVGPIAAFTIGGVLGAIIVFAMVGRWSRRPIQLFRIISFYVLLILFVPDIGLLFVNALPDTNIITVGALMLMHILTAVISVGILTTLGRAR